MKDDGRFSWWNMTKALTNWKLTTLNVNWSRHLLLNSSTFTADSKFKARDFHLHRFTFTCELFTKGLRRLQSRSLRRIFADCELDRQKHPFTASWQQLARSHAAWVLSRLHRVVHSSTASTRVSDMYPEIWRCDPKIYSLTWWEFIAEANEECSTCSWSGKMVVRSCSLFRDSL